MKTGDQLKSEGQAKAVKHAGSEWLQGALEKLKEYCIDEYCYGVNAITIDTFRIEGDCPEPANPNAWGALPKAAVRAGILLPTTHTTKAARPTAQARMVRVWEVNPAVL